MSDYSYSGDYIEPPYGFDSSSIEYRYDVEGYDEDLEFLLSVYKSTSAKVAELEKEKAALKEEIMKKMQNRQFAVDRNGHQFFRLIKFYKTKFNLKKLQEDDPGLYVKYAETVEQSRFHFED